MSLASPSLAGRPFNQATREAKNCISSDQKKKKKKKDFILGNWFLIYGKFYFQE